MSWENVTPETWLGALAMEEALMGGSSPTPMVTVIRILPSNNDEEEESQVGQELQQPQREEVATKEEEAAGEDGEEDEDDFFADLPQGARGLETVMPESLAPPEQKTKDGYSYYAYSYSTCTTLDDQLRRVNSTRRRYEDSAGCLKAVHLRKLGDQNLESTWMRKSTDEQGRHSTRVSSGDLESFEDAWKKTPFGIAHEQTRAGPESKSQRVFRDESPARELP